METQQFNFRVSRSILFDLEFISRATGLDKNDWVRYKLAECIRLEKERLIHTAEKDFINCRIDNAAFKELTGYAPNSSMIVLRNAIETRREELNAALKNKDFQKFARNALLKGGVLGNGKKRKKSR